MPFGLGVFGGPLYIYPAGDSYDSHLADENFQKNVIIEVGGVYFGDNQPDFGLRLDADKVGVISDLVFNASNIDIKGNSTSIGTISWSFSDVNGAFTALFGANGIFYGQLVTFWYGRVNANMNFSQYKVLSKGFVSTPSYSNGVWQFIANESTTLLQNACFDFDTLLLDDILAADTTDLFLQDVSGLPTAGILKMGDELITYTGISVFTVNANGTLGSLTGVTRGVAPGAAAADQSSGETCTAVWTITSTPMDIALKVMMSGTGDPTYDVFAATGANIDRSLIDVDAFTDIDTALGMPAITMYLYDKTDALTIVQDHICKALGVRLFMKDGLISAYLLNNTPVIGTENFSEDLWQGSPQFQVDDSYVTNVITIQYNKQEADGSYAGQITVKDQDSIDFLGGKQIEETYTIDMASVPDSLILSTANRMLQFLSTPKAYVVGTTSWPVSEAQPGDNVHVTHRYVPQLGAGLGISDFLTVLSRQVDAKQSQVKWQLVFSSFTGIRVGLIAPADAVVSTTGQSNATIGTGEGANWLPGFAVRLWDTVANAYTTDPTNMITDVEGDVLTFENAWTTTLSARYVFRFCAFDDPLISYIQKGYGFIADSSTETFPDGSAAYSIVKGFDNI